MVVLTDARLAALVEACRYPAEDKTTHTYVTLSSDTAVLDELFESGSRLDGTQQQRLGPEAMAWLAPAGGTLDSPFSRLSSKARYKSTTTTRNLRTMIKVRDATKALGNG
ncbi:hypothetical protein D9M72_590850 [compost metagenome]